MTRPLIAPVWREAPPGVQLWMEQVTRILTGKPQGGATTVLDSEGAAMAIAGSAEIAALSSNIQNVGGIASGGALHATYTPASLSVSGIAGAQKLSSTVTVTPVGGTGPYTHAWTLMSGTANAEPENPTSGATAFDCILPSAGETRSCVWRDTITDSLAATYTVDIGITVSGRYSQSSGVIP